MSPIFHSESSNCFSCIYSPSAPFRPSIITSRTAGWRMYIVAQGDATRVSAGRFLFLNPRLLLRLLDTRAVQVSTGATASQRPTELDFFFLCHVFNVRLFYKFQKAEEIQSKKFRIELIRISKESDEKKIAANCISCCCINFVFSRISFFFFHYHDHIHAPAYARAHVIDGWKRCALDSSSAKSRWLTG